MRKTMKNCLLSLALLVPCAAIGAADKVELGAQLSGEEQMPPVYDTEATGRATFRLGRNGTELQHELVLNNIKDVVQVHVHCAEEGANGPIGVTLYNGPSVTINGVLTQGPLTAPDSDNGCGWDSLAGMVSDMRFGGTYINVHTLNHLPGEIRGQIR